MSFYDARFHHTFQCLSLNVKDQYWERDLAEHEVWLPNWRRHQAKAGAVRALGRGSRLRIPRRRASPMLKSSWASASIQGWLVNIFCAWLKWDYDSPKCTLSCPSGVEINIKKKCILAKKWPNMAQKWHFWSFLGRPSWLIWCPVGGLFGGGGGAHAVSCKTPIYVMIIIPLLYFQQVTACTASQ